MGRAARRPYMLYREEWALQRDPFGGVRTGDKNHPVQCHICLRNSSDRAPVRQRQLFGAESLIMFRVEDICDSARNMLVIVAIQELLDFLRTHEESLEARNDR